MSLLDEWFGRASSAVVYAAVILVAVIIVCATWDSIEHDKHESDVRKACITSGGQLGEHNGWPVCTRP